MTAAFAASRLLFLAGYVYHKWAVELAKPLHRSRGFHPNGAYLIMLLTHVLLAMVIVPLVLRVFYLAIKGRYDIP